MGLNELSNEWEMEMRQIVFNTQMVRAILDGRKTVTRIPVKHQWDKDKFGNRHEFGRASGSLFAWADKPNINTAIPRPYLDGDILYVRELRETNENRYHQKADELQTSDCKHKSSIHMPKKTGRILLKISDIRPEKLQEITDADIAQEGVETRCEFIKIWDSTVKPENLGIYGWDANPWVWVIQFERIEKGERK